jgi:hypothetical protein
MSVRKEGFVGTHPDCSFVSSVIAGMVPILDVTKGHMC